MCEVNEQLFLLRTLPGPILERGCDADRTVSHATVISFSNANTPAKATQISTLGVERNPFYVSILHPRPCLGVRLCCASIGPAYAFRPDVLRAALRVFVPRNCKTATWTKAVSWFWKTVERTKGQKVARGKQWIQTGGLDFWTSLESALSKDLRQEEGLAVDAIMGRKELLTWLNDLLTRSRLPLQRQRHVLHTSRIVDPGTLMPVFDGDSDEGYRLLCRVDPATTNEDHAVLRCYGMLFAGTAPLLHEPVEEVDGRAWERLVELCIARRWDVKDRKFYYSPLRIRVPEMEGMCRSPRTFVDAGPVCVRPLDRLARIMVHTASKYLLVYDSTITPDSPERRQLLNQFEKTPKDLATIELVVSNSPSSVMSSTECIREVAARVYRKTTRLARVEEQSAKTVLLLDFAHWHLKQLLKLCTCFPTSRSMSKAYAAWVALNVTEHVVVANAPNVQAPTEWTEESGLASVFAWFDVTFIDQ